MVEGDEQRSIGRLEGKLDALIETVNKQGEQSGNSRKAVYDRIGEIETTLAVGASAAAHVSERITAIDKRIDKDVMPTIKEVRRLRSVGIGVIGTVGFAAMLITGSAVWLVQHIRWPWQ